MTTRDLTERRELAHRTNDGIDVTLFWSKASNRVTISIFHVRDATALEFEVEGADALDAFYHPTRMPRPAAHARSLRRTE
jgi:hypothetical protein